MKKNRMMRLASVLLVAVLMTTCTISGTFAKYVTSAGSQDTARVAVFGVEVAADYTDLFKSEYSTTSAWTDNDGVSVKSHLGGDVLAPGTDGDLAQFDISGRPEVDVAVTYKADLQLANWYVDHDDDVATDMITYCPIVITVNTEKFSTENYATTEKLEDAVEAAIAARAAKYNSGTDLAEVEDDLSVSWDWHFMGKNEGGTGPATQWDALDTELGNWQLNGKPAPSISLEIECTITQID